LSFRLESPIRASKFQFLVVLPPKFRGTSFRPPKRTSLRDFMSFELSRAKIHPRVWPVREPKRTSGQSNLTKSASRGAHYPVRGHTRGSKVVPLNSWGRVSY